MIVPWTLLKEYGKGKKPPRKKTPKLLLHQEYCYICWWCCIILLHMLCCSSYLFSWCCRWNNVYCSWINQHCFGTSQKKSHPFFNLSWVYLHWEYGSVTLIDECVRLSATEYFKWKLHYVGAQGWSFHVSLSACIFRLSFCRKSGFSFPVVIHKDFKCVEN